MGYPDRNKGILIPTRRGIMNTRHMLAILTAGATLPFMAGADDSNVRFRLSLDRVLAGGPPHFSPDFVLADAEPRHVRRFTEFSGDVSGRFIEALARAEPICGCRFAELDEVLRPLPTLQKPEGYFGEAFPDGEILPRPHMALLWGNGRMLTGLVEAHRRRGDPETLAMARKLGVFFVSIAPRLNTDAVEKAFSGDQHAVGYICWTQILEALVGLHEFTRDDRHLDLAKAVAKRVSMHPGQHSHGFLTSVRGMVDLYRATNEKMWIDRAVALWQNVIDSGNLLPHGCVPEAFKPMILRDEGCSEADWVRLNLSLWAATREPRYLDAAEFAYFNAFLLNQFSTGDFGHRTLSPRGVGGAVTRPQKGDAAFSAVSIAYGQARAWWCCTFHGLRAFPDVRDAVIRAEKNSLAYDLPLSGEGGVEGFRVAAFSSLMTDATCRIEVVESDGAERILAIRIPPWSDDLRISFNHTGGVAEGRGSWRTLHRKWKKGDVVRIHYPLRTRVVPNPSNKDLVGFATGPWMLGVDPDGSPAFFDEPSQKTTIRVPGLPLRADLPPPPEAAARSDSSFSVPAAHRGLPFIPGGYPIQPQTALLRPIAEQTGLRDFNEWVFWFRPESPAAP